ETVRSATGTVPNRHVEAPAHYRRIIKGTVRMEQRILTSEAAGGNAGSDVSTWGGKRPGAGRKRGAWSGKPFRDALARAVKRIDPSTGKRRIDLIAERLVREAIAGDVQAAKEIADRLDGRVSSHTEHGLAVSFVVRMPEALDAEA